MEQKEVHNQDSTQQSNIYNCGNIRNNIKISVGRKQFDSANNVRLYMKKATLFSDLIFLLPCRQNEITLKFLTITFHNKAQSTNKILQPTSQELLRFTA